MQISHASTICQIVLLLIVFVGCKQTPTEPKPKSPWTALSSPTTEPLRKLFAVREKIVASAIAPTNGGVYYSANLGNSWTQVYGPEGAYCFFLAPPLNDTAYMFLGYGGVHVSPDTGQHWTYRGPTFTNIRAIHAIINTLGTYDVFAATLDGDYVHFSSNGGQNWTVAKSGLTAPPLAFVTTNDGNVLTGVDGTDGVFLWNSIDHSWQQFGSGLPAVPVLELSAIGTRLFAGTYNQGIYVSTNNGQNWSAASDGLGNIIVASIRPHFTNMGDTLIISLTTAGLYFSTNQGVSWIHNNEGLPTAAIFSFTVGTEGTDSYLFVSTSPPGLFKRKL